MAKLLTTNHGGEELCYASILIVIPDLKSTVK